jgi:hypothetical protein
MPPVPLPLSFTEKGFAYQQVERQGGVAIYSQTHPGGAVRYEVIRIRIQREHTWPTGVTTPEKEAYPSANSWGVLGWTFYGLDAARSKLASLTADQRAAPQGWRRASEGQRQPLHHHEDRPHDTRSVLGRVV